MILAGIEIFDMPGLDRNFLNRLRVDQNLSLIEESKIRIRAQLDRAGLSHEQINNAEQTIGESLAEFKEVWAGDMNILNKIQDITEGRVLKCLMLTNFAKVVPKLMGAESEYFRNMNFLEFEKFLQVFEFDNGAKFDYFMKVYKSKRLDKSKLQYLLEVLVRFNHFPKIDLALEILHMDIDNYEQFLGLLNVLSRLDFSNKFYHYREALSWRASFEDLYDFYHAALAYHLQREDFEFLATILEDYKLRPYFSAFFSRLPLEAPFVLNKMVDLIRDGLDEHTIESLFLVLERGTFCTKLRLYCKLLFLKT